MNSFTLETSTRVDYCRDDSRYQANLPQEIVGRNCGAIEALT